MATRDPQDIADEDARIGNIGDRDLIMGPARAIKDKLNEDLTGGAYVGSRLNVPSNTRLGKMSAGDTRLLNTTDADNARDELISRYAGDIAKDREKSKYQRMMQLGADLVNKKKGGKVKKMSKGGNVASSASKRGDGIAQRGKTKGRFC